MNRGARTCRTRAAGLGLLLFATSCSSCHPSPPSGIAIEKLRIAEESLAASPELGLGAAAFQQKVEKAFAKQGTPIGKVEASQTRFRARAEVEFARSGDLDCPDGGRAEAQTVGVLLQLDPVGTEHADRIPAPVSAFGTTVLHAGPDERAASFQHALEQALDESAATLVRTAFSRGLETAALEAQLTSVDGGMREAAADVLVDRKDRAAIPVLIAELGHPDSEVALKAIGELVELKATEAVPKLIDLTTNRDLSGLSDPHLQIQVVYALGSIGGDEAEAFLYTMASGHPDAAVRRAATEATSELRADAKKSSSSTTGPTAPEHRP